MGRWYLALSICSHVLPDKYDLNWFDMIFQMVVITVVGYIFSHMAWEEARSGEVIAYAALGDSKS